ncbi:hypothetical protein RUM43_002599 [Polyplax serrata]|uniref:EF-hand domain-containing protein n=1 Tax=Polyplax serrata TaxID=468196 RepID=A0AAN8PD01_POLSC
MKRKQINYSSLVEKKHIFHGPQRILIHSSYAKQIPRTDEFLLAIDVTSSGTPEEKLKWAFRMYDVDGNGVIDIQEMTKIVQAIYDMLGACSSNRPADSAEERAKNIFAKMDENNDGQLTQEEFLKGCLQDEELSKMLAP